MNLTSLTVGCVTLVLLSCAAIAIWRKSRDPYGLFHLELNRSRGTEWLNMGYWAHERLDFSQACESAPCRELAFPVDARSALALKVARAGHCIPGGHVLDVGHACGDSLLLQLSSGELPRPATLTGITSLRVQHDRARSRVQATRTDTPVDLFVGDAVYRGSQDHPLAPRSRQYTSILAIDCAYHFDTRELFLRQAFAKLAPGGYVALADLAVDPLPPLLIRLVLSALVGVRLSNMLTPDEYAATLRRIGYDDVQVDDISSNVFPGFISFLQSRGGAWRLFSYMPKMWAASGGRFVLVRARKTA